MIKKKKLLKSHFFTLQHYNFRKITYRINNIAFFSSTYVKRTLARKNKN